MVVKTGVALPDEVYKRLQEVAKAMGYGSISKAIRDAVDIFIAFNSWWNQRGVLKGFLILLVDHERAPYVAKLLSEHDIVDYVLVEYIRRIRMEMMLAAVEGEAAEIKTLYKELTKLRGIYMMQPVFAPVPG